MSAVLNNLRLRIPGHWVDAWLYKESLVLWSDEGTLFYVPQADLRKLVLQHAGLHAAVLADYLVFRNDWKSSAQFRDLLSIEGLSAALWKPFDQSAVITVELGDSHLREAPVNTHSGFVLDSAVYGNRFLTATEDGLFETEFNPSFPDSENRLLQVIEQPAYAVSARGGLAAVSLGDDGLVTRGIHFNDGAEWWQEAGEEGFETVAERSSHNSFASYSLLNYGEGSSPSYLRASTVATRSESRAFPDTVISELGESVDLERSLAAAVGSNSRAVVDGSDDGGAYRDLNLEVVGNSTYRLLVRSSRGYDSLNVSSFPGKPITVTPDSRFRRRTQIEDALVDNLAIESLQSGFLLENLLTTGMITQNGAYTVIDEPRSRLRSFPFSQRHKDCFVAFGDDFVELVGFVERSDQFDAPF